MKRLLTFLSLLLPTAGFAQTDPLQTLLRLPKAAQLWEEIAPVEIRYAHFGADASDAMWLGDRRQIVLNLSTEPTQASQLCSLLFEMHNAQTHEEFIHLDRLAKEGEITCEEYVVACEWIEYQNAHKTATLLHEGRAIGLYPPEANLEIESDFASYLATQEVLGHMDQIRQSYASLRK